MPEPLQPGQRWCDIDRLWPVQRFPHPACLPSQSKPVTIRRDAAERSVPYRYGLERITWLREEFQLSELICWFNPGGLLSSETVLASMQRFATHVMPHFH